MIIFGVLSDILVQIELQKEIINQILNVEVKK